MTRQRIFRYICLLTTSLLLCPALRAQELVIKGKEEKPPVFGGIAVSADVVGLFMKVTSSKFSNMECAGRLNFLEKYFPIVELGIGDCTRDGSENRNRFSTTAPYFRVGMDYNFNKKVNGNRLFGGLRYGFSSYNFDFEDPDFTDPVWHNPMPMKFDGLNAKTQWLELVVGVETKLWSIVRLGWNIRYKARLHQSSPKYGDPWFIPGYGRAGGTTFGGSMSLIFDVGKSAKKNAGKNKEIRI